MRAEIENPGAPVSALTGLSIAYLAGSEREITTQALALKAVLGRVAVSPQVALLMAAHAGLGLRERR